MPRTSPRHPACRAVLLDRDGVLNRDTEHGIRRIDELWVLPGAADAVRRLTGAGYRVLVLTNQSGIGRGQLSAEGLAEIHDALRREVEASGGRLDRFYVCPHHPDAGCECRKPAPGLIDQARREWGFEPAETWFVGDAVRDVDAALAAGCRPALVLTGKGAASVPLRPGVPAFPDVRAFVDGLLAARSTDPR